MDFRIKRQRIDLILRKLGIVGKLALSATQRHQNHRQPTNIDSFRGHVLIFAHFHTFFLQIFAFGHFRTEKAQKNVDF